MAIDLTGPRAKVERAEEHFNALYSELHAFIEPYSKRKPVYHTFDGTWHNASFSPIFKNPPLRWSIICGDAIHNLIAALDHLVWQLVLSGDNKPSRWNSFPIYRDSKDFNRDVRFRKKNRGRSPLEGIDPGGKTWTAIDEVQPYHSRDPQSDPLATLKALDAMDKHRTLLVHMIFPADASVWDLFGWHPSAELLECTFSNRPISLEHETEILRFRFSDTWLDPQVNMKRGFAIEPTFGGGTIQVSPESLSFLYFYVSDLIDSFA